MFRTAILMSSVLMLTACTGSAYQLPDVSSSEVQSMQQKYADGGAPLKKYPRTDAQNRSILSGVSSRLSKNAKPLCKHSDYSSCHFEVVYNPDSVVNAYASEGYKITVYKGLMQYLKNNDEVATVVAHEMGHHLAKHNEEKMQNAATGAAVSGIVTAIILGAASANGAYYSPQQQQQNQEALENMMAAGAELGALSYSKEQEREADLLATYLLSRAGYDLKKGENVMVTLARFTGETDLSKSAFLDSHPAGMERVVAWEKAMKEIKGNPTKLPYVIEPEKTKKSD